MGLGPIPNPQINFHYLKDFIILIIIYFKKNIFLINYF